MEHQRFDELTVAIARGRSRRRLLRGLAGGVLGALAIDRSGALAKSDKPKKDDGITIFAKPVCNSATADCPLCAAARANATCCDQAALAAGRDQACGASAVDRSGNSLGLDCTNANLACGTSCVTATCGDPLPDSPDNRCQYSQVTKGCPNKGVCCNDYTSGKFGQCVANRKACN
jgi:hypothetical protein